MFIDWLVIDQCVIGVVEIFKKGVIEDCDYYGVFIGNGEVVDLDIVVWFVVDVQVFFIKLNFFEYQFVY